MSRFAWKVLAAWVLGSCLGLAAGIWSIWLEREYARHEQYRLMPAGVPVGPLPAGEPPRMNELLVKGKWGLDAVSFRYYGVLDEENPRLPTVLLAEVVVMAKDGKVRERIKARADTPRDKLNLWHKRFMDELERKANKKIDFLRPDGPPTARTRSPGFFLEKKRKKCYHYQAFGV